MSFKDLFKKVFCCCCERSLRAEALNEATFYEYHNAAPVYEKQITSLAEGDSYTLNGTILNNCERFSINFMNTNGEHKDVALHINPRLPQNYIVRNTRVKNIWGHEEVSSQLPFALIRGSQFSIQVLITNACYMISVNGNHFAEYNHRLNPLIVNAVEVKGDVENVEMIYQKANSYPERSSESKPRDVTVMGSTPVDDIDGQMKAIPKLWRLIRLSTTLDDTSEEQNRVAALGLSLPYYGRFAAGTLSVGRCVRIEGRVKLLPHSFYINLQQGDCIWPHPVISFHFNPRFSKQSGAMGKAIVCRNAWVDGHWQKEERSELDTNFLPGKTFNMSIVCDSTAYLVYVNKKLITEFTHHISPAIVDTIYIQGDIKLWNVSIQKFNENDENQLINNIIQNVNEVLGHGEDEVDVRASDIIKDANIAVNNAIHV